MKFLLKWFSYVTQEVIEKEVEAESWATAIENSRHAFPLHQLIEVKRIA